MAREGQTVKAVHAEFVQRIDEWLRDHGEQGLCIVDGKDDPSYRPAHRELHLKTRCLLEDPLMQSSSHSQLIQVADLVSYAAFQHVYNDVSGISRWYPELLAESFWTTKICPA
jgi:hypothetical protein